MLSSTELAALVDQTGYPVLMDEYAASDSDAWRQLVTVMPVAGTNLYGEKIRVLQTMGRFRKRADGEEIQADMIACSRAATPLRTSRRSCPPTSRASGAPLA
jgi:hypothetical protein